MQQLEKEHAVLLQGANACIHPCALASSFCSSETILQSTYVIWLQPEILSVP